MPSPLCAALAHRCGVALLISTFVFAASEVRTAELKPSAVSALPSLPEAVASFGAAVADGWLYVYGGHIGEAHAHSTKNLSLKFQRLNLASAGDWEQLPGGPGLQSPALVAHNGAIYRIGGLTAHNEPGEEEELESVADFARFDPKTKKWTSLAPLPAGRSSHDAVVVGDKLYVVGGWNLGKERDWHKTALVYDFADAKAGWQTLPEQTFQRRALSAAACNDRIYVVGGMTSENKPSTELTYFDCAKNAWAAGPALPGQGMAGFGAGAVAVDGRLYATNMDGGLFRLSADGKSWEEVAKLASPRFLHRLVPGPGGSVLAVGGASHTEGHLASIERFPLGDEAK